MGVSCGGVAKSTVLVNPEQYLPPLLCLLQAVNTLVLGKTRAKQFFADDHERTKSAAVLLHGDGAFSGQGIVFETLDLCGLFDYTVGGTIHLVVNNQVQ